jgi:hypothetical protein
LNFTKMHVVSWNFSLKVLLKHISWWQNKLLYVLIQLRNTLDWSCWQFFIKIRHNQKIVMNNRHFSFFRSDNTLKACSMAFLWTGCWKKSIKIYHVLKNCPWGNYILFFLPDICWNVVDRICLSCFRLFKRYSFSFNNISLENFQKISSTTFYQIK